MSDKNQIQEVLDEMNKATQAMREYVDKKMEEVRSGNSGNEAQAAIDKANAHITELRGMYDELLKKVQRPNAAGAGASEDADPEIELRKTAFTKFLRYGLGENGRSLMSADELRAISSASDAEGGFLVPTQFESQVIMAAYNEAELRPIVNVGTTGRDKVFTPSLKKPAVAWGVTNLAVSPQELGAGGETITIHDLKALVLIHNNTLDDAEANVWSELQQAFSSAIAEAEDDAFATGNGTTAPEGVMTNKSVLLNTTNSGVAAALNDSTHNGVDVLITALHKLKKTYRRNATWAMNSTVEGLVRTLKDGNGQYLWQPPVQAGSPATLLGRPVVNPEGMADIAANAFPIVVGDFRRGYRVRDRAGISVQRLVERYAEYDQTGFLIKKRTGGKVVLAEAFQTIKIAA